MVVLVDYDNVLEIERQRGVQNVIDKILHTIGVSALSSSQRVRIKLYGGWYERSNLSRRAQQLAVDIQHFFPGVVSISDGTSQISLFAQVELAQTMEIDPRTTIENTYRIRSMPPGLRCDSQPYRGCTNTALCPLINVSSFINSGVCPESGCEVLSDDLIRRAEQKLVDTMITSDIIFLASNHNDRLCVVSSDDDLWPGIKSALLLGARVYHIHTKPRRATPLYYSRGAGTGYVELALR